MMRENYGVLTADQYPSAVSFGDNEYLPTLVRPSGSLGHEFATLYNPEPGTQLFGFDLISELGRGSFSRVFLAKQPALANRLVVLKVAREISCEIDTLAQLRHTNIAPIYSIHESDEWKGICMPYLGAATLDHVVKELGDVGDFPTAGGDLIDSWRKRQSTVRGLNDSTVRAPAKYWRTASKPASEKSATSKVNPARRPTTFERLENKSYVAAALEVAAALTEGLQHAHENGILHRDIKPSNVLITDDGEPLLLDFNLAEDVKRSSATRAAAGGTLPYAAPEQIDEFLGLDVVVDERSDVFSIGVILYEMLTRRLPFEPTSDSNAWRAARILRDTPPTPVDRLNAQATARTSAVVAKCLASSPAQRYQSARELRDDLRACLELKPLIHAADPSLFHKAKQWAAAHQRTIAAIAVVCFLSATLLVGRAVMVTADRADAAKMWTAFRPNAPLLQIQFTLDVVRRLSFPKSRARVLESLEPYGVVHDENWYSRPRVQALPASEAKKLRRCVCGLLLMLSEASLIEACANAGDERSAFLEQARLWNSRAASAWKGGPEPKAVLLQRAAISRLANGVDGTNGTDLDVDAQLAQLDPIDSDDRWLSSLVNAAECRFADSLALLAHQPKQGDLLTQHIFLTSLCHREMENYKAAVHYLRIWCKAAPDHALPHQLLGMIFSSEGGSGVSVSRAEALDHLAVAKTLANNDPDVLISHAKILMLLNEDAAAVKEVELAEKGMDSKVYLFGAAARLAKNAKMADESSRFAKTVASLQPVTALDWLELGRVASDNLEAIRCFTEARKVEPWSIVVGTELALRLAKVEGRKHEALAVLRHLVKIRPHYLKLERILAKMEAGQL